MSLIYTQFLYDNNDLIPEIEFILDDFSDVSYTRLEIIFYIKDDEPIVIAINSFHSPNKILMPKILSKLEFIRKFYSLNDDEIVGILVNLYI